MMPKIIFKLTPVRDAEIGVYEDVLNHVFCDDDLKNIAVTGAYSSCKSSIPETYKAHKEKRFIHISLAHFETTTYSPENSKAEIKTV